MRDFVTPSFAAVCTSHLLLSTKLARRLFHDQYSPLSKPMVSIRASQELVSEEFFQLERLQFWVRPGGESVTAEAMNGYDTVARQHQ
jgi:hypothetical protein